MASWYEGILEITDIKDYQHDFQGMFQIIVSVNKLNFYAKAMGEYTVFRYICMDCSCNLYFKKKCEVMKNCFISGINIDKEKGLVISFISTKVTDEEYNTVLRGIKLNKLKKKIKST
jgi:hypothetical protein